MNSGRKPDWTDQKPLLVMRIPRESFHLSFHFPVSPCMRAYVHLSFHLSFHFLVECIRPLPQIHNTTFAAKCIQANIYEESVGKRYKSRLGKPKCTRPAPRVVITWEARGKPGVQNMFARRCRLESARFWELCARDIVVRCEMVEIFGLGQTS